MSPIRLFCPISPAATFVGLQFATRRSYVTGGLPGQFPTPGMPGGTWSSTGINGRWSVSASCAGPLGGYSPTTAILPYAFCELDNINGTLKYVKAFNKPEEVPVADGSAKNAYALLGGSFMRTTKNVSFTFEAELKNKKGEYVNSSIVLNGTDPVELVNNDGTFALKK